MGDFLNEALGAEFRKIVTKGCEAVLPGRGLKRGQGVGIDLRCREGVLRGDMAEADQGVHQRQLPGMIQFQAGDAFAVRQNRGLGQFAQLPPIDECLEDVLLDVVVVVDDRRHLLSQFRKYSTAFLQP